MCAIEVTPRPGVKLHGVFAVTLLKGDPQGNIEKNILEKKQAAHKHDSLTIVNDNKYVEGAAVKVPFKRVE